MVKNNIRLTWIDGLKSFAILGILLNHFVEQLGPGPWFSNPSYNWPDFSTRMQGLFPDSNNIIFAIIKFIGWLGDMGPGVFILLSGFALALSQSKNNYSPKLFFRKRLLRIFPLYITIHIVVLIFVLFTNQDIELSRIRVFLSLAGLRFHDVLFFFINPSWWFIWLIIQLYVIFPYLFRLLTRNKNTFIIATLLFTLLSRGAGLLHMTYSNNLYYWMTGLFFGTRLFEFTVGMAIGMLYYQKNKQVLDLFSNKGKILLYAILSYVIGFLCSLTYLGSLISNILITVGLSGIFYYVFVITKPLKKLQKAIIWIGIQSFPVFLLHQPLIDYASKTFAGSTGIFIMLFVLALSFPLGYILDKFANYSVNKLNEITIRSESFVLSNFFRITTNILSITALLYNLFSPTLSANPLINKTLLASAFLMLLIYYYFETSQLSKIKFNAEIYLIVLFGTFVIVFPPQWISILSVMGLPLIIFKILFRKASRKASLTTVILILTLLITSSFESYLRKEKPIEIGRWGEYPAIEINDNTVYSLIPNKTTHLKYNNYNYLVKTNSLGFNSPDIDLSIDKNSNTFRIFVLGDAFTMPEGMEFEKSYTRLLEQHLSVKYPDKKIQVINGGVTGYGPNEMLLQLKHFIDTIDPDLVINQIFINEFEEINLTKEKRRYYIGFKHISRIKKVVGYSQLSIQIEKKIRAVLNNNDDNLNYSKSLLHLYEKHSQFYNDTVIYKLDNFFSEIKNITSAYNSELLVMYVPGQIEVSQPEHVSYYPEHIDINNSKLYSLERPNILIRELCDKHEINLFDTENTLRYHPVQPVYYTESWHWNLEGHKLIAHTLCNLIKINSDESN